jgi:hypothetical protein
VRWLPSIALVLALLAVAACLPPAARADGDPASDVLVVQDAYFPYAPPTDGRYRRALNRTLAKARAAGYPVKVALIQTPRDLGAYPTLFNDANRYALLLSRELPQNRHGPRLVGQRILVVMPAGFGGVNLGDQVDGPLSKVTIDTGAQSNGLAVAAIGAVARLATANGHPVPLPPEARAAVSASKSSKKGGPSPVFFVVPALILFAGIWLAGRIASKRAT